MMRRANSRSMLASKVILLIGCAGVVLVVVATVREAQRRWSVQKEIHSIEEEIARIDQQRERLTDIVGHAGSPAFIEREARLRLGLQRPGETVLIVPESTGGTAPPPGEGLSTPVKEPSSNLQKWWRYVFH